MVSESELVNRLREILRTSDLNTTSAGAVRRQLETEFEVDLSDKKKFISHHIDLILHSQPQTQTQPQPQPHDDNINDVREAEDEDSQEDDDDDDDAHAHPHGNEDEDSSDAQSKRSKSKDEDDDEDEEEETASIKKRKGTGFTRLCSLSPQLQNFVGVSEMARTEVVKKLWAYIKQKDLQDPKNRRNIKCDQMLHSLFRVDTINMFQMNKILSKHIWPLQSHPDHSTVSVPQEKKQKRQHKDEDMEEPKKKERQKKGGNTGFLKPLQLSEAFVKFLGTGETTLCRSDAVKRIWDYIKENELQDPSDRRRILCDEKLKELFDMDSFNGFSVTKLLTAHLTKIEE